MADIIDQAQEQEAMNIANSLRIHAERASSISKPKAAGHCLNQECGEPFGADTERLFCGPNCAQRFDAIKRIKLQ